MVSPKTSFLLWDKIANNNQDVGGIGVLGTNNVSNFDDAFRELMAQLASGVDGKQIYATKSANYTALAADNNALHRFTAAATLSLTAAATLGANWNYSVIADGGDVTVDPNASETINGATTFVVKSGCVLDIVCDGTNFQIKVPAVGWETIQGLRTVTAGATAVTYIGLAPYKRLRLTWDMLTTGMTSGLVFNSSSDNGATWHSGASDYRYHGMAEVNGAITAVTDQTGAAFPLGSAPLSNNVYSGSLEVFNFNSTANATLMMRSHYISTAPALRYEQLNGYLLNAGLRNALRLFASVGSFAGTFELQGVRG